MAETLAKVLRTADPKHIWYGRRELVWNGVGVAIRGGVQASCWALRQSTRLRGWFRRDPGWFEDRGRAGRRLGLINVLGLVLVENCTVDASIFIALWSSC